MDAATLNRHIETHLRVHTFPLGLKSYKPGEPLPDKAKIPSKHMGVKVAICQAISIARRYGWTMAFSGEDLSCPIAKAAFGFEERNEYYTSGSLADGMYASCKEAGARFEDALAKYDIGEYAYVVAGPLGRANFIPDTVLVYGNSAQVLRLLNAALYKRGGSLKSDFFRQRGLHRRRHQGETDERTAVDPAVLRGSDLRDDRGRRDGVHLPVRPGGGNRRGAREDPRGRRPLPGAHLPEIPGRLSQVVPETRNPLGGVEKIITCRDRGGARPKAPPPNR